MNARYKDSILEMLRLLESKSPLSLAQIAACHPAAVTERTIQRYIKELREVFGLDLTGVARGQVAIPATGYVRGLAHFIKKLLIDRTHPPVHGEVSRSLIEAALQEQSHPATVMCEIMKALRESRRLTFAYKPQHPETRRKAAAKKQQSGQPLAKAGYLPLTIIPRGFSFGGQLMLVTGEAIYVTETGVERRERRQFAARGMLHPRCGRVDFTQLEFDFSEIYADSIYTWLGGTRYRLTIEDARFDETPRIYTLRANGEEEPLQFASAAIGKIRIIDPPTTLVDKAKELGLDTAKLFTFSA